MGLNSSFFTFSKVVSAENLSVKSSSTEQVHGQLREVSSLASVVRNKVLTLLILFSLALF